MGEGERGGKEESREGTFCLCSVGYTFFNWAATEWVSWQVVCGTSMKLPRETIFGEDSKHAHPS